MGRGAGARRRVEGAALALGHLALLAWVCLVLAGAGGMDVPRVLAHFAGLSLAGAGLIFVSSARERRVRLEDARGRRGARR